MLSLLKSLAQPSAKEQGPEMALIRGLAHVVAGAALAQVFGKRGGMAIYGAKELSDLAQGGDPLDSGFDAAFVGIGATQTRYWPFLGIGLGLAHAAFVARPAQENGF